MEYPDLVEQDDRDAASLAFRDIRPQRTQKRLDIPPRDVRAGRVREHRPTRPPVGPLERRYGTGIRYHEEVLHRSIGAR